MKACQAAETMCCLASFSPINQPLYSGMSLLPRLLIIAGGSAARRCSPWSHSLLINGYKWGWAYCIKQKGRFSSRDSESVDRILDSQFGDTKTVTVTVTNTYSFDVGGDLTVSPKFKAAFNFGASFSFSESNAEAKAITQTKPDRACNYCGYWALIPYYIT